ncbi:MAG: proline--tRNA ligase, partial [Oscillospiraceae bacterium]|nr:proline--tRNA ligase [Oscillospiraceae bacterium]
EEMDAIDGQEVMFPVVLPASLWQESGRYDSVDNTLARFSDRNESPLVLGMTHEEAAVHLVREYAQSYVKYPFMIYQIQTKFRDEPRPKYGLIRVREFTMKDAYSFHTSNEDLEKYFEKCLKAYERIFTRVGIPEVISVAADSGMMGGNMSYEFILLTPVGENSIAICNDCGYSANMEAAESIMENMRDDISESLNSIYTPNVKTIEDLCAFLNVSKEKTCKAVVYQRDIDDSYIVVFIRGDLDVNEIKLANYLHCDIHPAVIENENNSDLCAGYIGPYNLDNTNNKLTVLFDKSLHGTNNFVCGGNNNEYHYTGLDISRDIKSVEYHDFAKIITGGICPKCGKKSISISKGIEVGHIFQLGTKYTKAMGMQYIDSNGQFNYPIMGCYGIGIGRLAASICETRHDEYGPVWPMSVAPWQVHLCAVRSDYERIRTVADNLYNELQSNGVEVIYDDRNVSAGVMFSDADLFGVPLRVIISPRNIKENCCEIVSRDKKLSIKYPLESCKDKIIETVKNMMK